MQTNLTLAHTINGVNRLPDEEKREIYARLIPPNLLERFNLSPPFIDEDGNKLLSFNCPPGSSSAETTLFHRYGFPDPILYGHISDTINGQVHVLLYILNDPTSPRFDIDRMPDGRNTQFGTKLRNIPAEIAALQFGLSPGQVRRGLRLLGDAIQAFDRFVAGLGNALYFIEPLYYHNAILFERYGFAYEKGRKLMERIQAGFASAGDLFARLDGSTPFRSPIAADSIRLRSWALHDGLLGERYSGVTMYRHIGKHFHIDTSSGCSW